ncbi:hypothetical protein [Methanofollis sp. UBA420]|uniref:hypothetical protein n=1 Tax=Methanofollis sp. UBA420 TaxID=1915514 RepID=UPI00316AE907
MVYPSYPAFAALFRLHACSLSPASRHRWEMRPGSGEWGSPVVGAGRRAFSIEYIQYIISFENDFFALSFPLHEGRRLPVVPYRQENGGRRVAFGDLFELARVISGLFGFYTLEAVGEVYVEDGKFSVLGLEVGALLIVVFLLMTLLGRILHIKGSASGGCGPGYIPNHYQDPEKEGESEEEGDTWDCGDTVDFGD